jgi:anthraniloyl-CoA monooxygenase
LTQPVAVSADGRITDGCPGLYEERHAACWTRTVAAVRRDRDVVFGLRLSHAGRRGATSARRRAIDVPLAKGWPLVGPSPVPWRRGGPVPQEIDDDGMGRVVAAFVQAARWADSAGVDLLALDLAHGYLLGSFLSPLANRRDDEFGGSPQGRLRFPLQVVAAVRACWPEPKPLAVYISIGDHAPGGATLEDAIGVGTALREAGCDLLIVTAGDAEERSTPDFSFEAFAADCDVLRNEAGLPAMSTAYLTTSNQANTLLAGGRADLCQFYSRR